MSGGTENRRGISIALATCNGERFLEEQLDSLLRQSSPPAELVVSDDCSTDRTFQILETFQRTAPFEVRLFQNPARLGSRQNFLAAAAKCRNSIIAFCDQDDVWAGNKLSRMEAAFENKEVLAAIHDVDIVTEDLRPSAAHDVQTWKHSGLLLPLTVDPWFTPYGMSMLVRKEVFQWIEPNGILAYDSNVMGHDRWAWLVASVLGCIAGVTEKLVKYRQHGANLFGADKKIPLLQSTTNIGRRRYQYLSNTATQYAKSVSKVADCAPPEVKLRATAGKERFEKLAALLKLRSELYSASDQNRMVLLSKILKLGGYTSISNGGLGKKAFIKDFALGALQRRVIP